MSLKEVEYIWILTLAQGCRVLEELLHLICHDHIVVFHGGDVVLSRFDCFLEVVGEEGRVEGVDDLRRRECSKEAYIN